MKRSRPRYSFGDCRRDIRDDFRFAASRFSGRLLALLFNLRLQLVVSFRLTKWLASSRIPGRRIAVMILRRWQLGAAGCDFAPQATIGRRLRLPHPTGIVIGIGTRIGDDVTLYQHVTLGTTNRDGVDSGYPRLEDGVTMYAGSIAVGAITIGTRSIVGALSLVRESVPSDSTVVGVPARVLSTAATAKPSEMDQPC